MFSKLKPGYVYRDITEDIADHDDDYDAEEWVYDGREVYRGCVDPAYDWDVYRLYDDNSRCVGIAEHEGDLFHALWIYDSPFSTLFQEPEWKARDATIWSVLSNEAYQDCLDDDFKSLVDWFLHTNIRLISPSILMNMPSIYTCEICGKMSISAMSGCSQLKKSSYLSTNSSLLFVDNSFVLYSAPKDSQVWSIVLELEPSQPDVDEQLVLESQEEETLLPLVQKDTNHLPPLETVSVELLHHHSQ